MHGHPPHRKARHQGAPTTLSLFSSKLNSFFLSLSLPFVPQPFAAWDKIISAELDGTKSGLARILGRFHSNQISVGFKISTRLDDVQSRSVMLLRAGGMLMPTEAHYLDDAYLEDRVKCFRFYKTKAAWAVHSHSLGI